MKEQNCFELKENVDKSIVTKVTSDVVSDLVKYAEFIVFVVIMCPLKVSGQT